MTLVKDPFRNPTAVITNRRLTLVAGAAAGNLTVTGISLQDRILSVQTLNVTSGAVADLTSEFTITAANTINNGGGTATTGAGVFVEWEDHDMGFRTDAPWNE